MRYVGRLDIRSNHSWEYRWEYRIEILDLCTNNLKKTLINLIYDRENKQDFCLNLYWFTIKIISTCELLTPCYVTVIRNVYYDYAFPSQCAAPNWATDSSRIHNNNNLIPTDIRKTFRLSVFVIIILNTHT